jgi:uncharacterized protein involved in exopolysaccharide biosynthesis
MSTLMPVPGLRPPQEGRGGGAPLLQLLIVLFKWRRLILGLCLAFTAAAAIAMLLKPTERTATARILFKPDRIPLQISGLVAQSSRLPHSPQMLQSEAEMMESREVLLPAARALIAAEASPELPVTEADVEGLARELDGNLQPVVVPDTNLIQLTYTAPAAAEAERRLKAIVDHYLQHHGHANSGSAKLLQFYEEEASRVGTALQAAEDGLRTWQQRANVVNVDAQLGALLTMLADREKALRQTDAEIQGTTARLQVVDRQRVALPERTVTVHERIRNPLVTKLEADVAAAEVALKEVDKDPTVAKLRGDLTTAELALQDLLQRYMEGDRRVQEKREHAAFLRDELGRAQQTATTAARERLDLLRRELQAADRQAEITGREVTEQNRLREELDKTAATARAELMSLGAERGVLARQVQAAQQELAAVRDKKMEAERRARDVEMRREAFVLYGKKLEEARVAAGLEKERLSSVAVVESPHAREGTDTRRRLTLVLMTGVIGLALGVAIAFGAEFLSNRLRTVGDVEYYLGVPVLAAIPDAGQRALALPRGTVERTTR